jgi:hypothetical protein
MYYNALHHIYHKVYNDRFRNVNIYHSVNNENDENDDDGIGTLFVI